MQGCSQRSPCCHFPPTHSLRSQRQTVRRYLCAVCCSCSEDLYSILSVPATASQTEIKAAYRKLVHDLHPDKHAHKQGQVTTADAFLRCKLAYEVLSDAEQRQEYNQSLAASGHPPEGQAAPAQQHWSPYNGWMDAYGANKSSSNGGSSSSSQPDSGTAAAQDSHSPGGQAAADYYQAMQEAATATAAASASSSGLADYTDPLAAVLGGKRTSNACADSGYHDQQMSAAVQAALLQEHGLVLEQFASLQDALAALAEKGQQQTVVGLAEGDYDTDPWQH